MYSIIVLVQSGGLINQHIIKKTAEAYYSAHIIANSYFAHKVCVREK